MFVLKNKEEILKCDPLWHLCICFNSTSSAGDTETAEAGLVLTTDIKSSVDATEEEQQLKDKDIRASKTNSTLVRPFADVKGNISVLSLFLSWNFLTERMDVIHVTKFDLHIWMKNSLG